MGNTFIEMQAAPVHERIVQSMPRDFFRNLLMAEAEAADKSSEAIADVVRAPATPPQQPGISACWNEIAPGTQVIIEGLVKLPAFNGVLGTVQSFNIESGRYDVLFAAPVGESNHQWAKVKRENLRLAPPPPPRHAPTLVVEESEGFCAGSPPQALPTTPTWEDGSPLRLNMNSLV